MYKLNIRCQVSISLIIRGKTVYKYNALLYNGYFFRLFFLANTCFNENKNLRYEGIINDVIANFDTLCCVNSKRH